MYLTCHSLRVWKRRPLEGTTSVVSLARLNGSALGQQTCERSTVRNILFCPLHQVMWGHEALCGAWKQGRVCRWPWRSDQEQSWEELVSSAAAGHMPRAMAGNCLVQLAAHFWFSAVYGVGSRTSRLTRLPVEGPQAKEEGEPF